MWCPVGLVTLYILSELEHFDNLWYTIIYPVWYEARAFEILVLSLVQSIKLVIGMMSYCLTKCHTQYLGGRGMLECVCVCRVFLQDFEFLEGRSPKFGDVEGVYST